MVLDWLRFAKRTTGSGGQTSAARGMTVVLNSGRLSSTRPSSLSFTRGRDAKADTRAPRLIRRDENNPCPFKRFEDIYGRRSAD